MEDLKSSKLPVHGSKSKINYNDELLKWEASGRPGAYSLSIQFEGGEIDDHSKVPKEIVEFIDELNLRYDPKNRLSEMITQNSEEE